LVPTVLATELSLENFFVRNAAFCKGPNFSHWPNFSINPAGKLRKGLATLKKCLLLFNYYFYLVLRIRMAGWVRTQKGKNDPQKWEKSEEISCFEVLYVHL
jgi:hypothetical protein